MTDIVVPGGVRLAGTFGRAATIYRRRFVPFIVVTMISSIPGLALSAAQLTNGRTQLPSSGAWAMAVSLLNAAAALLASGAVMSCVVEELRGRAFSPADSIRTLLRRLLPMLGVAICTAFAMAWGVVVIPLWSDLGVKLHDALERLLPGIDVAAIINSIGWALGIAALLVPWCALCLSLPVCIAEKAGVLASLSRSRRLTRGHRFKVSGTLLVFALGVLLLHSTLVTALASAGEIALFVLNATLGLVDSSTYGVLAGVLYHELRVARDRANMRVVSVFD